MSKSLVKEYWENPDDPDDNGYVWICNACGAHGHEERWDLLHMCDASLLAEAKHWEKHYTKDMGGYTNDEVTKMLKEYNQLAKDNPRGTRDVWTELRMDAISDMLTDAGVHP